MSITTLPAQRDRLWLTSFWVALSISGAVMAGGLAWLVGFRHSTGVGALVLLALALAGLLKGNWLSLAYRAWNRLARLYSDFARQLLLGICFYTVVAAAARAGSLIRLKPPFAGGSNWVPRKTLVPDAYRSQDGSTESERPRHWPRSVLSWAGRSRHLWVAPLIAFLLLMRKLESGQGDEEPENIYTLY